MRTKSSGSPRGRASSAIAAALGVALALAAPAAAQTGVGIIVIDMARVRQEAALAVALRDLELGERRELRQALDRMREALEAEEARLAALRDDLDRDAFDAQVRVFDDRVRLSRRQAQDAAEALQSRFAEAQRAFDARVRPVLEELMRDRGAGVAFERSSVLGVAQGRDATDALIRRLDLAAPASEAEALLPAPQPLPVVPGPAAPSSPDAAPEARAGD